MSIPGVPLAAGPGQSCRILCIGDPQYATSYTHPPFWAQIDYILAVKPSLVVFMGDCTDDNTPTAWSFFAVQLQRLTDAGIQWMIATGNHDYEFVNTGGQVWNRNTNLNSYVSPPAWLGGQYQVGHMENTWAIFSLADINHLVMSMEWSPRDAVVTWASSVIAAHASYPVILITHAFVAMNGARYDWATYNTTQVGNPHAPTFLTSPAEGINDGRDLWDKFIANASNVKIVLGGHTYNGLDHYAFEPGARWRRDIRGDGTSCVQILCDYQNQGAAGDGWVADFDLDWANEVLTARTLSPYLGNALRYTGAVLFREPIS